MQNEVMELLNFSQGSSEPKTCEKSEIQYSLEVHLDRKKQQIIVKSGQEVCLFWNFIWTGPPRYWHFERIGDVKTQFLKTVNYINTRCESPLIISFILNLLFENLHLSITQLIISTDLFPDLNPFLSRIQSISTLEVSGRQPISNRHLKHILESIQITDKLIIRVATNPDFYCPKAIFTSDKLIIYWAVWVCRENILNFQCSNIVMKNTILSAEDIVSFVSKWYNSSDKRLQSAEISGISGVEMMHFEEFRLVESDPKRRASLPTPTTFLCTDGMDIERSDGLLATIFASSGDFYFYVWHNRVP